MNYFPTIKPNVNSKKHRSLVFGVGVNDAASKAKAKNMVSIAKTQLEPIRSGLLRHAEIILKNCTMLCADQT